MKEHIKTARFVEASDIFAGFSQVWDLFCESEPDFSWGNNNRTLINPSRIISVLEDMDIDDKDRENVAILIHRLVECVNQDVYVDLEN